MASRRIVTGIDVGTNQVKVVVTREVRDKNGRVIPRVIGTGLAESKGLRHGYVIHHDEVVRALQEAKAEAERASGIEIKKAFLAIGGSSIDECRATGEAIISRADAEITELDIERAKQSAREALAPLLKNRRVLHEIPLAFRIDGQKIPSHRPEGLSGTRLEIDILLITCFEQHLHDLVGAVEETGIEIIEEMASPLAGSFVTLSKEQKVKGCVLANIGAETVSIVVYEEGIPVSVKVFEAGSTNITEHIALELLVSLEDAEKLKLGRFVGAQYSRDKVQKIITKRLTEIFTLIDAHLKSIGKTQLPAGIILSGGGAGIGAIQDVARNTLELPARACEVTTEGNTVIKDSSWAVAYGLTIWGLTGDTDKPHRQSTHLFRSVSSFFKQFLP